LFAQFGFTVDNVLAQALELLESADAESPNA
jgi:hypothetical protein